MEEGACTVIYSREPRGSGLTGQVDRGPLSIAFAPVAAFYRPLGGDPQQSDVS